MQNVENNQLDRVELAIDALTCGIKFAYTCAVNGYKQDNSANDVENFSKLLCSSMSCVLISANLINAAISTDKEHTGGFQIFNKSNAGQALNTLSSALHKYINREIKALSCLKTVDDIYDALFEKANDGDAIEFIASHVINTCLANN